VLRTTPEYEVVLVDDSFMLYSLEPDSDSRARINARYKFQNPIPTLSVRARGVVFNPGESVKKVVLVWKVPLTTKKNTTRVATQNSKVEYEIKKNLPYYESRPSIRSIRDKLRAVGVSGGLRSAPYDELGLSRGRHSGSEEAR
jgi:hypothetical protein